MQKHLCLFHCPQFVLSLISSPALLFFFFCHSCSEGFGLDAKPKLASYHQIFLAPSEEEKGSLPTPDDGNLWHMFPVA